MTTARVFLCVGLAALATDCRPSGNYLTVEPRDTPIVFLPEVVPEDMLVHSGIFSPDLNEYYFTVSDRAFTQFDVHVVRKEDDRWGAPSAAFFNSVHYEHGTSFSPDGHFVYFSSTRPTEAAGVARTWHIWRSEAVNGQWTEPQFIDIPNMRDKLVSHPSIGHDGVLYFHAGNLDYSDLAIWSAAPLNGAFQDAIRLPPSINSAKLQDTPHIAPDGSYLLFERPPDLYISYRDPDGEWSVATRLEDEINTNGKGNPFVTPDGKFLFFVASDAPASVAPERWSVFWVSTATILE